MENLRNFSKKFLDLKLHISKNFLKNAKKILVVPKIPQFLGSPPKNLWMVYCYDLKSLNQWAGSDHPTPLVTPKDKEYESNLDIISESLKHSNIERVYFNIFARYHLFDQLDSFKLRVILFSYMLKLNLPQVRIDFQLITIPIPLSSYHRVYSCPHLPSPNPSFPNKLVQRYMRPIIIQRISPLVYVP